MTTEKKKLQEQVSSSNLNRGLRAVQKGQQHWPEQKRNSCRNRAAAVTLTEDEELGRKVSSIGLNRERNNCRDRAATEAFSEIEQQHKQISR